MGTLIDYLKDKAAALRARRRRIERGELGAKRLSATVSAEGRSGIRRIRIREFQIVTDAPPDFAGYNLGPSAPEVMLGSLGSCLVHTLIIQAAWLEIPVESVDVEVSGTFDARTGHPAFPDFPVGLQDIAYTLRIQSPADAAAVARLHASVEKFCPILAVLRQPQTIAGQITRA